jgi:hypothetical protein
MGNYWLSEIQLIKVKKGMRIDINGHNLNHDRTVPPDLCIYTSPIFKSFRFGRIVTGGFYIGFPFLLIQYFLLQKSPGDPTGASKPT